MCAGGATIFSIPTPGPLVHGTAGPAAAETSRPGIELAAVRDVRHARSTGVFKPCGTHTDIDPKPTFGVGLSGQAKQSFQVPSQYQLPIRLREIQLIDD
jgi:hypothetical protein